MKIKNISVAASVAIALSLFAPSAAQAATSAPTPSPATACWGDVVSGETECASTQQELAEKIYVEHGVVFSGEVPSELKLPAARQEQIARTAMAPASTQASYIMGVWYDGKNRTGSSWTHSTDVANPCSRPGSYTYGQLGSLRLALFGINNWDNRIRSFVGQNHCGFKLWSESSFQGSTYGPKHLANDLGAMDKQASSLSVEYVS